MGDPSTRSGSVTVVLTLCILPVARVTVDPDTWQQTVSVCQARWKSSTLARATVMLN